MTKCRCGNCKQTEIAIRFDGTQLKCSYCGIPLCWQCYKEIDALILCPACKDGTITYSDDFLSTLHELCISYDKHAEEYPESPFEGFALYYFALHRKDGFKPTCFGVHINNYEEGTEYKKDIGVDD